jgi:anti-sigma factor RsiW
MTADHHPEELVDRALRSALDPGERSTLDRHLAQCVACAAHVALAPRFEQELAPRPRDELLDRRAVEAVMRRMPRMDRPWPVGRSHAWPRWLRVAAAGILLASAVTATAAIVARRVSSRAPVVSPVLQPVQPPAARSAPVAPPKDVPEPAEQPCPSALPPRASAARPAVTAAALFERAGKLRREGRADAAIAVYRRLQDTFPGERETQLSFALAGQLLLERGRPGDALAQFDRHPKIGGDVGEEALAGRAAALEQLHRTADAIAAWESLLERYPGSIYAARAHARLAQLGEPR